MIDHVFDVSVVVQWQVPIVQKIQVTLDVPQVQHRDQVVGVFGGPRIKELQTFVEIPQVPCIDSVVDVFVEMQRRRPTTRNVQKSIDVTASIRLLMW